MESLDVLDTLRGTVFRVDEGIANVNDEFEMLLDTTP